MSDGVGVGPLEGLSGAVGVGVLVLTSAAAGDGGGVVGDNRVRGVKDISADVLHDGEGLRCGGVSDALSRASRGDGAADLGGVRGV